MNLFGGHDCEQYEPKEAKKGDTYKCGCGSIFECIRVFPWKKWKMVISSTGRKI